MSARGHTDTLVAHDLTLRVDEAEEALTAIRSGAVDALVVSAPDSEPRVFLLRGADEAHRVLLETLNEGAMTVSADGTILYANRRLAELLERPLEKVLGAPLARFLDPRSVPVLSALLSPGKPSGKAEVRLAAAGGALVPVMISVSAVGGEGDTFTVVVTDLGPLKEAETALRRANDELEERVSARTAEIERVNTALRAEVQERTRLAEELRQKAEQLEEADRRKDEFLSMLAHELRNPLSPILTAIELLRPFGRKEAPVERYRTVIERQTHNLTRLVDDLLDVSRITRRAITLRREVLDLAAIVHRAIEVTRPLIDANGHRLTLALPAAPTVLFIDPMRFEQVLVNLLTNAAKYTDRGGRIHLSASAGPGGVEVRVSDNGMGIAPDLLPRVFDLFVQGKRSLARSQGGLGIGLTLVKNLVEMHGGTIDARSPAAGGGTEMIVRLPPSAIAEHEPAPPSADDPARPRAPHRAAGSVRPLPSPDATPTASPRRVLVVEDNLDAAESLVELLESWGFGVTHASDGETAIHLSAAARPHVALVDIGLPGMNGFEVARRLREAKPPPRAPVSVDGADGNGPLLIGITGYGQERDRQAGALAGFDHYLVKPVDADVLWEILQERGRVGAA